MDEAELLALASEIRRDQPGLSPAQALHAASAMAEELLDLAGDYDERTMFNLLAAWDQQAAAAGNPVLIQGKS